MITKYNIIFLTVFAVLLLQCKQEQEPPLASPEIEISKVRTDEAWNIKNDEPYTVEVHVQTNGSNSNLLPVVMAVKDGMGATLFTDSLYDDGAAEHPDDGDVIAGDGVFRNRFRADRISDQPTVLTFAFQAADADGNESAVYTQDVRFDNNFKPEIVSVSAPDTLPSGSPAVYLYAAVFDKDGTEEVTNVLVEVFKAAQNTSVDTFSMFNDGNFAQNGDVTAGDSVYSFKMDSAYAAGKQGEYRFRFTPYDAFTTPGQPAEMTMYLENLAGQVSTVFMADSVPKPTQGSILVQVAAQVNDPQGLGDVDSVYFTLEDSQGKFVRDDYGNIVKIPLFDDGDNENNGDQTAGDGLFSVILQVTSTNRQEAYTLHFYERDLVGNLSADKQKSFVIY
ncbi:MAG TPA: hypothetical protein ENK44_01895 [Caldithrix abyssi]|uniref:DUF4625 domain-containing protein n=1 Tax=Caldithrix abyssi TaxID=187145 RepID=A0A7V4TZC1_CALAY|nr:hypothetical protein [Caldithrix abyssi]